MNNNYKNLKISKIFVIKTLIFLIIISLLNHSSVFGAAPQELKGAINQKSQELQEINNKVKEAQNKLEEVQGQSRTLGSEINKIDSQVNQIKLSITSSEIMIDKLGLEINSLQYDISDAEKEIIDKKEAISKILQEMQQKDNETALMIFLKNKSLSNSVFEIQGLANLNEEVANEVTDLKRAKNDLSEKFQETTDKKQAMQFENGNLKNKKLILDDTKQDKQTILKQTKNQEQLYQKSVSELEKRQAEISAEIEKLEQELRLKIDPSALPIKRPGVLGIMIDGVIRVTQEYGITDFAIRNYSGKWHNGLDFGVSIGTPILAAEKGKVFMVANQDNYCYRGAYGKYIVIEHENNLTTLYAHLSLQVVKIGDEIQRGQLIGYSGRTGWATGPHLHFTVWQSSTFSMKQSRFCGQMPIGGDLNPMDYLSL